MPRHGDLPDRQENLRARKPVQSCAKKYSALYSPQINGFIVLSCLIEEGRTRRHERGGGMRWTRARRQTTGARADGEVVWSWRSDAGAKVAELSANDGGNQAWSPGRARSKPLKPLRREGRVSSAEPVVLPRAFLLHADHGCQPVPGLPCALSFRGTNRSGIPRTHCAARTKFRVSCPSRQ